MNYIFFGPYWVFCFARAAMTGSYGRAEYGAFRDFGGLVDGFMGTLVWLLLAIPTAILVFGLIAALAGRTKWKN